MEAANTPGTSRRQVKISEPVLGDGGNLNQHPGLPSVLRGPTRPELRSGHSEMPKRSIKIIKLAVNLISRIPGLFFIIIDCDRWHRRGQTSPLRRPAIGFPAQQAQAKDDEFHPVVHNSPHVRPAVEVLEGLPSNALVNCS